MFLYPKELTYLERTTKDRFLWRTVFSLMVYSVNRELYPLNMGAKRLDYHHVSPYEWVAYKISSEGCLQP